MNNTFVIVKIVSNRMKFDENGNLVSFTGIFLNHGLNNKIELVLFLEKYETLWLSLREADS